MIRFVGLVLLALAVMAFSARAASEPKEVDYIDLKISFEKYLTKNVRMKGGFHYLSEDGNSFLMQMEAGAVTIDISALPEETIKAVRGLRNFSEIPITVTGIVKRGGVQRDQPLIAAKKLDIEDSSTQNTFASRKGILTVPEMNVSPFRYLGTSVTMQGRFDFLQPGRNSFRLWRGVDEIEVDYSHLSPDLQRQILGLKNFSNQGMKITGILRPSPNPTVAYVLEANSLQLDAVADPAQMAAKEAQNKSTDITYDSILLHPERYVKKSQILKGGFELCDPKRKVLQIWQGGDSIEVFYREIPPEQNDQIESQKPFNSIVLVVTGVVRPYPKAPNRFMVEATNIAFDKGD